MCSSDLVTGVLTAGGKLDIAAIRRLSARALPLKTVLHRAFDDAHEPHGQIDELIDAGICRILTSGQRATAPDGAEYIAFLQAQYGDRITIMPGCGVNANNIAFIYQKTGCTSYHLSGKKEVGSGMVYRACIDRMNTPPGEFCRQVADFDLISAARAVLDGLKEDAR